MSRSERIQYSLLLAIGGALTVAFGIWWMLPAHISHNFTGAAHILDILLFALLTYVVWHQIANELFTWYLASNMQATKHMFPELGKRVALLTAFVPGSEPYSVLEKTVKAMTKVHYPHDTWVLDEGNDARVQEICTRFGAKHFSRKNKNEYNTPDGVFKAKTKAGNYNAWYDNYAQDYDFVAQHDVDFAPKKTFLTHMLGYFRDPQVGFVGSPQIYGNVDESWIARGAAEQAYGFYGHIQRGLFAKDNFLFIGANHIVRVAAHEHIGGYSSHIVEDHLTGMHMYANNWKSVYVPEILAVGEGPATWDAYFGQQMRWAYGLIDILFRHSPKIFPKMKFSHMLHYFFLQQYYFDGLAQGIGVVLLALYFFFGIQSTQMELMPILLLYVPVLIMQQVIAMWLQRYNIDPENEKGFHLRGKLLNLAAWPIYMLAFFCVIVGKRLTYKVTPKGDSQPQKIQLSLFLPHVVLGTVSALSIIASAMLHHNAPQLLFFAVLNTITMYFFVGQAVMTRTINKMRRFWQKLGPSLQFAR